MVLIPHYNDCMCDGCMVKYYEEGLIHENTPAHADVKEILKNRKTKVISGFPAVGKSTLTKESHYKVLDSDSSSFSKKSDFPNNYIRHIQDNIGKADYILVSSHDVVRKALKDNDIDYTLVYPSIELKYEYLDRYRKRGNDRSFILFVESNWDNFIKDIEGETFPTLLKLNCGQYLSDVIG